MAIFHYEYFVLNFIFAQVRTFFLFFSLFMLFLSCVPCNDKTDNCAKTNQQYISSNTQQQHHHNFEACSPFCTCSCCAISVVNSQILKSHPIKVNWHFEKYPQYSVAITSQTLSAIWQPPRLS